MKKQLTKLSTDNRYLFFGTFDRYGITGNRKGVGQHILLTDIRDAYGIRVAKYIWFDNIKTFLSLDLVKGDTVAFYARVIQYEETSYVDHTLHYYYPEIRYRLLYPNKASKLISAATSLNNLKEEQNKIRINIRGRNYNGRNFY